MSDLTPGMNRSEKVRTNADGPTYGDGMTIETRDFGTPDHPYQVVTERLTVIDGREYVRCPMHGLIALDHACFEAPSDHWCRTAAHPAYDPATGADGLDDQGCSHTESAFIQSAKIQSLADALLMACLYLEGFVWVSDPEASEMDYMKDTVAEALGCKTWEQAMELARLRDARRAT